MPLQPDTSSANHFVHLVVTDPVVLRAVEDRKEDVEVSESVGQTHVSRQREIDIARVAEVRQRRVQRQANGVDRPAQRLEQARNEVGVAAARH